MDRPRLGRRPGKPDTRAQIAESAWELFLTHGYQATSIRAVARAARCDPKLVRHHFGSKEQLFAAGMQVGIDTDKMVNYILQGGLNGLGVRFITALTTIYESPIGAQLTADLRTDPAFRHTFWTMIGARLGEVGAELPLGGRAQRRRSLVQVQAIITGFIHGRYLDQAPPVAALTRQEAIAIFGGLVQQALVPEAKQRPDPDRPARQRES